MSLYNDISNKEARLYHFLLHIIPHICIYLLFSHGHTIVVTLRTITVSILSIMRLRKDISCTQKLKDGKADDCRKKQHITSPAYPDLLRAQLIPFNHQATPAAFPTLTAQPLCNDISSVQSGLEKKEQQLSEARSCELALGSTRQALTFRRFPSRI